MDDEILKLFLEEAIEHLEGIENDILAIETMGEEVDSEVVNRVFRAIHTIKGGAGFFALNKIQELTHVAENLLDKIRHGEIAPNRGIIEVLLETIDVLLKLVTEPDNADEVEVVALVEALGKYTVVGAVVEVSLEIDLHKVFGLTADILNKASLTERGGEHYFLLIFDLDKDLQDEGKTAADIREELEGVSFIIESETFEAGNSREEKLQNCFCLIIASIAEKEMLASFLSIASEQMILFDVDDLKETIAEAPVDVLVKSPQTQVIAPPVTQRTVSKKETKKAASAKKKESSAKEQIGSESVRVSVKVLEKMMSLGSELVLARNQLNLIVESCDDSQTVQAIQQVDSVTSQLQETIMQTRMQSIGIVLNKFTRVVRDLSNTLGKKVKLTIEGQDVELDKTIIEAIGDPLMHIVRNSMDHGLETPDVRLAAGKREVGNLFIRAYQEAGKVLIEISDDGGGIDPERVLGKALESGILSEAEASSLSEREIVNLIFKPGFSTADEVTEVSGRGVGMDVVQTNLSAQGGTVDLTSKLGEGTLIKISLPLTLAVMPALLVSIDSFVYAIPQVSLLQVVRVAYTAIDQRIQIIAGAMVIRFMDELLPIIPGSRFLSGEADPFDVNAEKYGFTEAVNIAVVASGDLKYGMILDYPLDSQEIVVKPLGRHLNMLPVYSGATILGSGEVAPILNITGIAHKCGIDHIEDNGVSVEEGEGESTAELQHLLLMSNFGNEQLAMPMQMVKRIEKIAAGDVEDVGSIRTCKYRGKSLSLFKIEDVADLCRTQEADYYTVAVFEIAGKEHGILVNEIVECLEVEAHFDEFPYKQTGVHGSARIADKLVLLLDHYGIVAKIMPQWVSETSAQTKTAVDSNSEKNILVVDDSKFFVNQIAGFLEEDGYRSVKAENGKEALDLLLGDECIDLVLLDIEMPVMDGWEFTRQVRQMSQFNDLPIIAVTSVAGEMAEKKGKELGINDYLIKLDREEILKTVKKYLRKQVG